MKKISSILIVGGGTAGLICALALRRKVPAVSVSVIRSKEIGVIGVGEGTVAHFGPFFFDYLGLDRREFYRHTNATWKLGIRFNWGNSGHFNYCFAPNCDWQWDDQRYPNGYYCEGDHATLCQNAALMDAGNSFLRQENDDPLIDNSAAFHLENVRFVDYLENQAAANGVQLIDARISEVTGGEAGVAQLTLDDGRVFSADLYVDASGFRSLLLGDFLGEPFASFDDSLFCDRAIIGAWQRSEETILPFTTSDTMTAGWSWRIDHEHHINRGYVYSSAFLSPETAEAEFRGRNPLLDEVREISFTPGKHRDCWVRNVVAIGNACGFVEPLEATSIQLICLQSRRLVESLISAHCRPDRAVAALYNDHTNEIWESVRRFLALHYKFNDRLETPFWQHCRQHTVLGDAVDRMVDFYRTHGPDIELMRDFLSHKDVFGLEGYLTLLTGLGVSYDRSRLDVSDDDRQRWQKRCEHYRQQAGHSAVSVRAALGKIRSPDWQWY